MATDDYCEMCDLPLSTCVHGRPEPVPAARPTPVPRAKAARRVPGTRSTTTATPASAPRRWTSPEELRPAILATLQDAGGELDGEVVFDALEERLGELLRPGDREANPQGELRWRAAARKARKALMDDGLLATAPGAWRLTDAGRAAVLPPGTQG